DSCQTTLKKQKLDTHVQQCYYAQFSCIDCSKTFQGTEYRAHTSCITENEKYQKSVYKAPKKHNTKIDKSSTSKETANSDKSQVGNISLNAPGMSIIDEITQVEKNGSENGAKRELEVESTNKDIHESKKLKTETKIDLNSEKSIVNVLSTIKKVLKKKSNLNFGSLKKYVEKKLDGTFDELMEDVVFSLDEFGN
ncbi:hypothetical protein HK096_010027, partial [Nowakowskiella sp. JEL0078]